MTKPRCYQYAYKINKIVSLEFVTKKKISKWTSRDGSAIKTC